MSLYFELSGGSDGCRTCDPWVGTLVVDGPSDTWTGLTMADMADTGLFHTGCQHEWAEIEDPEKHPRAGEATGEFTDFEKSAMADYQMSSYGINEALRGPKSAIGAGTNLERNIASLDSAFIKSRRVPPGMTLARGVDAREYRVLEKAALQGKAYKAKGYVSTTSDPNIAKDFGMDYKMGRARVVEVRVPPGTPAIYVDETGLMNSGASEVLLQRGQTFAIGFADNRVDIVMELIP